MQKGKRKSDPPLLAILFTAGASLPQCGHPTPSLIGFFACIWSCWFPSNKGHLDPFWKVNRKTGKDGFCALPAIQGLPQRCAWEQLEASRKIVCDNFLMGSRKPKENHKASPAHLQTPLQVPGLSPGRSGGAGCTGLGGRCVLRPETLWCRSCACSVVGKQPVELNERTWIDYGCPELQIK